MKKILLPICFCMLILVTACKKGGFLTATQITSLNKATVFADSTNAIAFLGHIYTQVGFSFDPTQFGTEPAPLSGGIAGLESACDEAQGYSSAGGDTYNQFNTGTVNSTNITATPWTTCYQNIRAANIFLKNIKSTKMTPSVKLYTVGEAHFLRAWFYSILLEYYGGVPIVYDTVYNATDKVKVTRNTFSQCVNYIVSECNIAESYMPPGLVGNGSYYGRASAGACLALESRVLLYAASPLYSVGGNIAAGNPQLDSLVGYVGIDSTQQRWTKAKNVAGYIISGLAGFSYSLFTSVPATDSLSKLPGYAFKNLFHLGNNGSNKEYIFEKVVPGNSLFFENLWEPPSHLGTQHAWPYEEMADAFGMNNGKPITDPASGYDPLDPYKNRDPRFDFSILHNNELVFTTITFSDHVYEPLQIYVGSPTGDGIGNGTPTGYYIAKMLDDHITGGYLFTTQDFPLMRYAEILLNYAEAYNESKGTDSAYVELEAIRARAGITSGTVKDPFGKPTYGLAPGMTKDQMRLAIQNERRVELAYESHRFWDVRRWKIADITENQLLHGMKITKQPDGSFTYQRVEVSKHSFNKAMYFWPIPQSETSKSALLKQNPYYER